jgi:HK97 family phage major capsid protein
MSEEIEQRHIVNVQEDATTVTITMEKNPEEPEGVTESTEPDPEGGEGNAYDEDKDKHRATEKVVTREAINAEVRALEESNVVELSFSSETPVERDGYLEVLDHNAESVNLTRLNNRAPLLLNHDPNDQIGVVESARIDDDKVGRAVVRFSKSARAQEIYRDILDKVRGLTSIGYYVLNTVREQATEGLDTLRASSWLPLEISVVSVPADPSVGVGRSVQIEQPQQTKTIKLENNNMSEEVKNDAPNVEVIAENTRNAELKRSKELTALGARYNCMDDAHNAIQDGKSPGEFSRWILDNQLKTEPVQDKGEILAPKEEKRFSLCDAVAGYLRDGRFGGYENEVSQEAQKRYGRVSQGLLIPNDLKVRDVTAATSGGGLGYGGNTIEDTVDSANFIDRLSNMVVVEQAGATVLSGLQGNVSIPRMSTGSTAYWVAEQGSPTEAVPSFDQVALTPKRLSVHVNVSKQLMIQSSLDMENVLRNDILKALAIAEDSAAINGSGSSNEPTGIINASGIGDEGDNQTINYSEIWNVIKQVDQDNALMGDLVWLTSAAGRAKLATTEVASSTAKFLLDSDNRVGGYPLFTSNNVPDNLGSDSNGTAFIFGNIADLIIGRWDGVEILVDPFTSASSGTVRLIVSLFTDIAVRHPESFAMTKADL